MCLASVRNGTTCKCAHIASGGAAVAQVVGMSSVNVTGESERVGDGGEGWQIFEGREDGCCGVFREGTVNSLAMVPNAPFNGASKVLGNTFEALVMDSSRGSAELRERDNGVANVRATEHIGKRSSPKRVR